MKVWAFDLDGCLIENLPTGIYGRNDPSILLDVRIRYGVAKMARQAVNRGDMVIIVTGRQRTVRSATLHTLKRIFGETMSVWLFDIDHDGKWNHHEAIAHKMEVLKRFKPEAFFGDRLDFDKVAADGADIPFIHTPTDDPRWD